MESEDPFAGLYIGVRAEATHPVYMKWTMVFSPRDQFMEAAYSNYPLDRVIEDTARALEAVKRMDDAVSRTDPSKAPDPGSYRLFSEGFAKTSLWLRTMHLWRECWWRVRADRDLIGAERQENRQAVAELHDRLETMLDEWKRYPEEAGFWRITYRYGRPVITPNDTYPGWLGNPGNTLEKSLESMNIPE
jgi:hypothetical protein